MATVARTALAVLVLLLAVVHDARARPGDVDRGFGTNGVALTKALDGGFAGTVQPGGKLLVAGGLFQPGVVRFTTRGRRDRTFGSRGIARVPGARDLEPLGIRRTKAGIRVAGATITTDTPPVELLRMSTSGRRRSRVPHADLFPGPIVQGIQRRDGGAHVLSFDALRAVDPDGRTDVDFAGGTLGFGDGTPSAIAERPDGRVLVAVSEPAGRITLRQFTRQGTPDPAFGGGDGQVRLPLYPERLLVARGGDVVAATGGYRHIVRMIRYSAGGQRRRAFGVRGVAGRIRSSAGGDVHDVAEDRRGRLYVLASSRGTRVVAFTRSGRRIVGFGRRGIARLPRPANDPFVAVDQPQRLVLAPRRRLYVVGSRLNDGFSHPALGCGIREDLCASEVAVAVWRLKRL